VVKPALGVSLDVLGAKATTVQLTLSAGIERFSRNQQLPADFHLSPFLIRMRHKQN